MVVLPKYQALMEHYKNLSSLGFRLGRDYRWAWSMKSHSWAVEFYNDQHTVMALLKFSDWRIENGA